MKRSRDCAFAGALVVIDESGSRLTTMTNRSPRAAHSSWERSTRTSERRDSRVRLRDLLSHGAERRLGMTRSNQGSLTLHQARSDVIDQGKQGNTMIKKPLQLAAIAALAALSSSASFAGEQKGSGGYTPIGTYVVVA